MGVKAATATYCCVRTVGDAVAADDIEFVKSC